MDTTIPTESRDDGRRNIVPGHDQHAPGPPLCPVCLGRRISDGFGPQLRLIEPATGFTVLARRLPTMA
jgi:hypothetical protein